MADWVEQLELICEKNPIIRTYKGWEIVENPGNAERTYARHAETHMSLGDTGAHLSRILTSLERNKRVFVGGVSGEYGLGKTSMATYMWRQLEKDHVVAVPPFCWTSLDEIFSTVHAWVRYKLRTSPDAQREVDAIYGKFASASRNDEIARLVRDGLTQERATDHVDRLIRNGMAFERTVPQLFAILSEFTGVVKRNGFRGLVVFTDELQEAVQKLGAGTVFSLLFAIGNTAQDYEGAFGFFFSMPANTRQQILDTRSDVMDRLVNQRLFVDLATVYSQSFAKDLWNRYAEFFDFHRDRYRIVSEDTLDALGQLTDSTRRDLGNGPRTVISAFRAIAEHWKRRRTTFTPLHLAEVCLNREVLLGENSQWIAKVERLLSELGPEHAELVKLMAAFPQGCPEPVLRKYGHDKEKDKRFLRSNLAEHLREVAGRGYVFFALEGKSTVKEAHYERVLRTFAVEYSPQHALKGAVTAMAGLLEEKVFGEEWTFLSQDGATWSEANLTLHGVAVGTFRDWGGQFPARRIAITVTGNPQRALPQVDELDHQSSVFGAHLVFVMTPGEEKGTLRLLTGKKSTYAINVGLAALLAQETILSRYMERSAVTVQAGLALLAAMADNNGIPEGERPELSAALNELANEIVASCLTREMGQIQGSTIALRTSGAQMIRELLLKVCSQTFPNYRTLMIGRDWKSKMQRYATVLDRQQLGIPARRGQEDLLPNVLPADLKKRAADLFNYGTVSPFEGYCAEVRDLLDVDWKKASFRLKSHPAERAVIEWLSACPESERLMIDGTRCEAVNSRVVMDRFRGMGYTLEELHWILTFGKHRGYFNLKDNMIYRKPFTVAEYREQVAGILAEVKQRVILMELVKEKVLPVDAREVTEAENDAEGIESEEDFQHLKATITSMLQRCVDRMRARAEGERQQMDQQLRRLFEIAKATKDEAKRLSEPLAVAVPWVSALNDTRRAHAETWSDFGDLCSEYRRDADTLRARTAPWSTESLESYGEYVGEAISIARSAAGTTRDLESWDRTARHITSWESAAAFAADAIQRVLTLVSGNTERWSDGLQVIHDQAAAAVADINKDPGPIRALYSRMVTEVTQEAERGRHLFQDEKRAWSQLLSGLGIKADLYANWSEAQPEHSYQGLRAEAAGQMRPRLDQWRQEFAAVSTDLRYAESVLGVSPERTTPIAEAVANAEARAEALATLLADPVGPEQMPEIQDAFEGLRSIYAQVAAQTRLMNRPGEVSIEARQLLQLMGQKASLRNAILAYAGTAGRFDLDEVLELVMELFRKNQVDITITARGPQ